jgi:hypothetical protein
MVSAAQADFTSELDRLVLEEQERVTKIVVKRDITIDPRRKHRVLSLIGDDATRDASHLWGERVIFVPNSLYGGHVPLKVYELRRCFLTYRETQRTQILRAGTEIHFKFKLSHPLRTINGFQFQTDVMTGDLDLRSSYDVVQVQYSDVSGVFGLTCYQTLALSPDDGGAFGTAPAPQCARAQTCPSADALNSVFPYAPGLTGAEIARSTGKNFEVHYSEKPVLPDYPPPLK